MEAQNEIKALGFRFEEFGKNAILVSGIPADISGGEKELFEGLLEQFKINKSELSLPLKENLARSLAKRAAIKSGQKLKREELEALVEGLFACNNPNFSPDGASTFFIFDASKIENCFNQ
jgi:DNA mismatch repair protein MutL